MWRHFSSVICSKFQLLEGTTKNLFQKLNSPLHFIDKIDGIELWMKRDDLIHPAISGNKWRKLKYYLQDFRESTKTEIITFGGAFSNHLAATAYLGQSQNIQTTAIVRGEEVKSNPTLDFCRKCGMNIVMVSREEYRLKDNKDYKNGLGEKYPEAYLIPEGGKGLLGIQGCTEITQELDQSFDFVCCSGGTATTFAGLILSDFPSQYVLYPALKGGYFLKDDIQSYTTDFQNKFSTTTNGKKVDSKSYALEEDYHFGGYGKVKPELIDFMNGFYRQYKVPLDPIYTGKMMFGIIEGIKNGRFGNKKRILAIHTGGLQGISGINERLRKSGKTSLIYEMETF